MQDLYVCMYIWQKGSKFYFYTNLKEYFFLIFLHQIIILVDCKIIILLYHLDDLHNLPFLFLIPFFCVF